MDKIVIIGGGGHAKICIDILKQINVYSIIGIIEPKLELGMRVLDVPVIENDDNNLKQLYESGIKFAVNGLGFVTKHPKRQNIYKKLISIGFNLPNLIHPSAVIEPSVKIGEGNQFMANSVVGSNVTIGNNCIINSGSIICHDVRIADNVHIAPGAILAGEVSVSSNTLVGMGVTVYLGLEIGSNVTINNGVNVFKNIPNDELVKK